MPTAGEANIRPTNPYNLRNKPLPKAKPVVRKKKIGEKENIPEQPAPTGPVTRSRSKIPVATNQLSKTKGQEQKPKRKGVPDFAKLHKQWQNKFEKGKAVNKKTCTQVHEFDLTKPGARFKGTYYNAENEESGRGFREDHKALESILNDEGISENATRGHRNTIATAGANHAASTSTRKTLGSIPVSESYQPNNANNMAHSTRKIIKDKQKNDDVKKPRKSLAQQQQDMGIEFEEDLGALASILNNTGLSHARAAPTYRQTFASSRGAGGTRASLFGGQPQTQKRTSIYYQPQASTKDAYEDYTRLVMRRLTTGDNGKPMPSNRSGVRPQPVTSIRTSIYQEALPMGLQRQQSTKVRPMPTSTMKSTPGRVHVSQPSKPTSSTKKTPMTASRVPNPHFHSVLQKQEITSSPLLSGSRQVPESHLQTPATQRKVQWADDTVAIPSAEELATSLFTDQTEPIAKVENRIMQQMEKYKEIEKLEKQLELEIQMLSNLGDLGDSRVPGNRAAVDGPQREVSVERTGEDGTQQTPLGQVPVNTTRYPQPCDAVTFIEGCITGVNSSQNNITDGVRLHPPQTARGHPSGGEVHRYQVPSAGVTLCKGCSTYTSTAVPENISQGHSQTSFGLRSSQEIRVVGKPGPVYDQPNLVCPSLGASQNIIPQSSEGVTSIGHHHLVQSSSGSQGLNSYEAGHVTYSGGNVPLRQMCSECHMNVGCRPHENLTLARPVNVYCGDGLGSIPTQAVGSSVGPSVSGNVSQPVSHGTIMESISERNGVICSPVKILVPSLKVSKVSKTVKFASPLTIRSGESKVCGFRTTPHPGMQPRGVTQNDCMDGVKGRLEFGTDCDKTGQNLSTNAAVSNAGLTSSVNATTLSEVKTGHLEPVTSTEVKGHEASIQQSEVMEFPACIKHKGQTVERITDAAAGGNVETLSLRGHLQHCQDKRQAVTEFKGRAGLIFQEALLDQECTLYAHSLQRKLSIGSCDSREDFNPVAKIFMEEDDAHFCPIVEESFS